MTLAGSGAYLANEVVLKHGKSSKVSPKNVNCEYVYLDSDGNEVIKTEEGEETHNNNNDDTEDRDVNDYGKEE